MHRTAAPTSRLQATAAARSPHDRRTSLRLGFCTALALAALPVAASAQGTLTTLYDFGGLVAGKGDGGSPSGGVTLDAAGNLYGVTSSGGTTPSGCGTAFMLAKPPAGAPPGTLWAETQIHRFADTALVDGAYPYGGLTIDGHGALYGTTNQVAGKNCSTAPAPYTQDAGTVYQLTPPAVPGAAWGYKVLHVFTGGLDGSFPMAAPVLDPAGNLFGTTTTGKLDSGTVYEMTPPGGGIGPWTFDRVHSFQSTGLDLVQVWPDSSLTLDPAGNLYGTFTTGGGFNMTSGFYVLPPPPSGAVTRQAKIGTLPISTAGGGGNFAVKNLARDGQGNLYGTTGGGGKYGFGAVFMFAPPTQATKTWTATLIYSFSGTRTGPGLSGTDGSYPQGGVVFDASGNLVGTTSGGGTPTTCCGTIYALTPFHVGQATFWGETVLYRFSGPDGALPNSTLTLDAAGNFYGTTAEGSNSQAGTVFMFHP